MTVTTPGGTSTASLGDQFSYTPAPTVVTEAASAVTHTLATLHATVNPNGGTVSDCHFEYGTSEAYGSTAPCASLPGSGESPVAVYASLGSLSAKHHLPLQDLGDQPGRHEQRLRPDVHDAHDAAHAALVQERAQ